MKVVQITAYGGPEVLEPADAPLPEVTPGSVRIKIVAAGVNPADYKWRSGMFRDFVPVSFPHVLGYDIAGTIDGLGDGVEGFSRGDGVAAMLDPFRKGGYAEFAVIDAANVAKLPNSLGFDIAATLPTPALTGVQLISEHVRPKAGETVLITGATGAVGRFAMHTAREFGARVIAAVRESHLAVAHDLGAESAVVLGEETELHFDHVADTVGGKDVAKLCRRLPAGARIISVATTPIDPEELAAAPTFIAVHPDGAALESICQLVAEGTIRVAPVRTMSLADASLAHQLAEAGSMGERIVLHP